MVQPPPKQEQTFEDISRAQRELDAKFQGHESLYALDLDEEDE